jgi:EAL domain-containing protein (putative c-di-GMP-specific phosphodiesterase class I)
LEKKILIFAANPKNTTQLRLAEEVREIEEALKRAENRNQFILQTRWAVRPRDLMRAMTELKPNIIHFCGHGQLEGIALEDNQGNAQLISIDGLANLFKSFTTQVECVLLNACYSKSQADAIGQYIDHVIGMEQEIKDKDAIEFAVSFYDALGAGETYESAYKLGCVAMQLAGSPENLLPSLNQSSQSKNETVSAISKEVSPGTLVKLFKSLPSILDKYDKFVDDFTERINFDNFSDLCISNAIRDFFNAKLVYVYKYDTDHVIDASRASDLLVEEIDPHKINSFLRQHYIKALTSDKPHRVFLEKGSVFSEEAYLVIIPREQSNSLIIVLGTSGQLAELEDVFGIMLGCLYEFDGSFGKLRTKENIRDRMYDALKRQYNYVSDNAYEIRFEDFRKSLNRDNIQVFFEPIIFFDRREENITIFGWEALARDPKTGRAPTYLFQTVEMWGVRFQTELDLYILENALDTYKGAAERARTLRYDEKKWLSVNVYPSSILRSKYDDLLDDLLNKKKLISGKKLILEISEKTLLPAIINDTNKGLDSFKAIARKYRKNYDISFAVDDFGVGNAAISRLEYVDPTFVKVDRDILHFDKRLGMSIIEYLVGLKFDFNYLAIVEGFDEYSNFSLHELVVDLGVEYIQGHHFGIAAPEIKARLDKDQYQKIFDMLGWKKSFKN